MNQERSRRKIREGIVVSDKMDKTVIVRVERTISHPKYGKIVKRAKRYYVHDEGNACKEGQMVTIVETRPLSKSKRWRVVNEGQIGVEE